MKAVAQALYSEPVVFLGVLVGVAGALATAALIPVWVVPVTVAIATPIQRSLVRPTKR